jgi:hypothetical protein
VRPPGTRTQVAAAAAAGFVIAVIFAFTFNSDSANLKRPCGHGHQPACPPPTTTVATTVPTSGGPLGPPGTWNQVFTQDFTQQTSFDTSVWRNEGWGNCTTSVDNTLGFYALHMALRSAVDGNGCQISSNALITYGAFEALVNSAALPGGGAADHEGWWTAGDSWPSDGEFDIYENDNWCVHTPTTNTCNSPSGSWAGSWHTYTVDWEPGANGASDSTATFYWDGVQVGRATGLGVSGHGQRLRLNLFTQPGYTMYAPADLYAKYIKVWQHTVTTTTATTTTTPTTWQATLDNPAPPGSFWTRTIAQQGVTVDPNSTAMISYWLSNGGSYNPTLGLTKWGYGTAMTDPAAPGYTNLEANCSYPCNLDRFGAVHIPLGTKPSPDADAHLSILDNSGKIWDMYHASYDGAWHANAGEALDLTTEFRTPDWVYASTNGAIPNPLVGLTPRDLAAGFIDHPLAFASPGRASGSNRCPSQGVSNANPGLPNGALLRLNPGYDVNGSALPAWQKTVAHALQDYGMYFVDNSPNLTLTTEVNPNNQWASLLGWTGDYQGFSAGFPWGQMQVMTPPC